jgi:hypothetical protein
MVFFERQIIAPAKTGAVARAKKGVILPPRFFVGTGSPLRIHAGTIV